ncbi:MAG TPA: formate dehydrogenase accessory sulfurtransferase FdhD [Crocinitomicaceae bacterium]|nr:formate dehydrogenase accessory sulfurtransferase FdhD [Crocinitomicaceae bacterium]
MATRNYQGKKFTSTSVEQTLDSLTIEEALQININGKPFTITMRTPGDDANLVRGLLHTEGILKNLAYHPEIILKKENKKGIVTVVDLTIPEKELGEGYSNSRSLLSVSSCGICGRTELEEIHNNGEISSVDSTINAKIIEGLFAKMNEYQKAFHQSGGTHAAAAFDKKGNILCSLEDIGRHNAVDKVIGKLIIENKLNQATCMTVSGRISYEIIVKSFKAKIPVLAAVSAPSSLSVDYAKELGITLFAFCREGRATCYANPQRVKFTPLMSKEKIS